jgi:hypothetical protein
MEEFRKMANSMVSRAKTLRRLGPMLLGACMICMPVGARAANHCAWLNEATASGLLGGEAIGEVTETAAAEPIVCTFIHQDAGVKRTLRVTVELSADPHARLNAIAQVCGSDETPLRAIGNEALSCAADDRKGGIGERVIGRVRDQVFTITISSTLKNDPGLNRDVLRSKIYTAAEQVSGNLF